IFRRPVHVVSMYNARLRRRVQTVMQGIAEVQTTAARTGQWAGIDAPEFGPLVKKTFVGATDDESGERSRVELTMEYPEWCAVTVWRIVAGQRVPFTEKLWFVETYARATFRSELPNARWQQAPRQMLAKCAKASALRAGFPEEAEPTADE